MLPTLVQAENFNTGGEGVAYYTYANTNKGGQYRTSEGVSIEASTGGGYNIGWTAPGEWFNYTVQASDTGRVIVQTRVASSGVGGSFHYLVDGVSATAQQTVPDTQGWQSWAVSSSAISLTPGTHLLQLHMDNAGPGGGVGRLDTHRQGAGWGQHGAEPHQQHGRWPQHGQECARCHSGHFAYPDVA